MTDPATAPNEEPPASETDRVKSPGPSFVALLYARLDAVDLENLDYPNPPNEEELVKLKENLVYMGPMTDMMKRLFFVRMGQKAALDKIHIELVELDGAITVDQRLGRLDACDPRIEQLKVLDVTHGRLHDEEALLERMATLETVSAYPDYRPGEGVLITPDWKLYLEPEQNPVEDMLNLLNRGGYEKFAKGLRELFENQR